jgi:hypothetical protein
MKKGYILAAIIIISIATLIFIISRKEKQNQVCFENNCFLVELAKTPEERSRGLMFRGKLDQNTGMLFIFPEEGEYSFWMKNTLIPLDIIWINSQKEIVFISENAQPCKEDSCPLINPTQKAKYVLEVNPGISGKIGLKVGKKLDFNLVFP